MTGLNERSGKLASLESTQMQDYAQRWLSNHDVNDAGSERLSDAMRVVASGWYEFNRYVWTKRQ